MMFGELKNQNSGITRKTFTAFTPAQKLKLDFRKVQNIVGKGVNAGYPHGYKSRLEPSIPWWILVLGPSSLDARETPQCFCQPKISEDHS